MTGGSFEVPSFVRAIEDTARAGGWKLNFLAPGAGSLSTRPWLQRAAQAGASAPRLYVSAGIHGDEISGPLAVLEMLRQPDFFTTVDTTIFPILNPEGLARGIRENGQGIDLNRDYRNTKSEEILHHLGVLQALGRFDGAIFLHEDYEGIGVYLFELNDGPIYQLGRRMIAAMGRHLPIDRRETIDDFPSHEGVIQRSEIVKLMGPIEEREEWPEAIYLTLNHTDLCYTTETPKPFPLEQRIQAQIAAVQTLIDALNSGT